VAPKIERFSTETSSRSPGEFGLIEYEEFSVKHAHPSDKRRGARPCGSSSPRQLSGARKRVRSDRLDDTSAIPTDYFRGSIGDCNRHHLRAPRSDPDDGATNPVCERKLKVNPIAMSRVHPSEDQKDICRPHLTAQLVFKLRGVK
jgi:hypothetical protein